ncbi:alanine--tRNA ligase [Candidatus Pacearchaeota archaeon]|nr:alanine--tRNA ligase [Candidatus Pacearchaeota archaeon]
MTRKQLIKKYIDFFKSKDHKQIPNSSLIPENDPTVLFTTAGMQPLVPNLLGEKHPLGKRLVNNQKCIRTVDFENIGDTYHHTFFEMLGHWSLGDYWKKEAVEFTLEFITKILGVPIERLAASCFKGDKDAPKDTESEQAWLDLGIPKKRIAFLNKEENFWGPAGKTGPCGPNTEIFYWKLNNKKPPEAFDPQDNNWVELGNDVLMGYNKNEKGKFKKLEQKNIDFGGGVERIVAILNNLEDDYLTDAFKPIIEEIEYLSGKKYKGNERTMRIIADHIKAAVFIIADGIIPSNTEQGYVLRRLIRRTIMNLRKLGFVGTDLINPIAEKVFEIYNDYPELKNKEKIFKIIDQEEERFDNTLEKGLREFEKMSKNKKISGKEAFLLFQSYGFPLEITKELAQEKKIKIDEKGFENELAKHQKLSRTAAEGKFKSGLADNSEATTRLHTATHLLNQALREVLKKPDIFQKGSNITPERLRFDFNFDRKLTDKEQQKVEDWVNDKIKKDLLVKVEEMTVSEAKKAGAQGVFESKYGEKVKVYKIGKISTEICAGPHVKSTGQLGKFKIKKEESSAAGVRRIKAVLE